MKTPADTGDSIGVVFANGAIMDGEETQGNVGGDTTAAQIRDARLDPKVKAVSCVLIARAAALPRLK